MAELKKGKAPPEPSGAWPVIGHLHLLGGSRQPVAKILGAMADKCGPAFMLRLGMGRALVVSNWELARECLTTNDKVFATRPTTLAGKIMGYDNAMVVFTPYGSYWREIRKRMSVDMLSLRRLGSLKQVWENEIGICVRDMYQMWVKNGRQPINVEMKQWFADLTLNAVMMMVVGKRYGGTKVAGDEEEARKFHHGISELFRLTGTFVTGDALPFMRWMDLEGHEKAMKQTAKELDMLASKWLEEHRERRATSSKMARKNDEDFMDVLISNMEHMENSDYSPDTIVKATVLAVILGANDTSTVTLVWALSLLMNNPHVLKRAQEELEDHVGKNRHVETSDIQNLVYLQAIVKETLRLYPAAPLAAPHMAAEDCYVGGFYVPAGTQLLINLRKIQRDPHVWSEPSEFKPERFLSTHADVDAGGQHFELIPFGSGRRMCPGLSFANQVLHWTLARLIHGFGIATPMGEPVDMTESLGLTTPKASPLHVVLSPRLSSQLFEC